MIAEWSIAPSGVLGLGKSTPRTGEISKLLARLEQWLVQHRAQYHHALRAGANRGEVNALKQQLGRRLPASLRALLSWHNGQVPDAAGCFEQNRRLMGCSEIAAAVKERIAASSAGHSSDYWDPAWIPFLDDDAGNYVCLDTSRPGAPLREVILGRSNQQLLAPSLLAWLNDFVVAAERGNYVEDPERGDFFRKRSI